MTGATLIVFYLDQAYLVPVLEQTFYQNGFLDVSAYGQDTLCSTVCDISEAARIVLYTLA